MPKSLQKSNHYISPKLRKKNSEKPKDRIALNDKVPRLPNITKWVMEKIKIKSDSYEIFFNLYKPWRTSHFHKFPKQRSNWRVEGRKLVFKAVEVEVVVRAAHTGGARRTQGVWRIGHHRPVHFCTCETHTQRAAHWACAWRVEFQGQNILLLRPDSCQITSFCWQVSYSCLLSESWTCYGISKMEKFDVVKYKPYVHC